MEKTGDDGEIRLNLGAEEYLAAVEHQAKPLVIPLCLEVPLPDVSPIDACTRLRQDRGYLLESMEGSAKIARYSFLGLNPELVVTIDGSVHLSGNEPFVSIAEAPEGETPIDQVRSILQRFTYINLKAPRFFGGLVGYFAYDLVYDLYGRMLPRGGDGDGSPTAQFMLTRDCVVFDHRDRRLFIFSSPLLTYDTDFLGEYEACRSKILSIYGEFAAMGGSVERSGQRPRGSGGPLRCSSNLSRAEFGRIVDRVKEHIRAGDIFQCVVSRRMECDLGADPFAVYRTLRTLNPSPYMYYLDFGDLKVIGSSPEMLVRVEKRRVTTVPIAGTRPRGGSEEEDRRLAGDLLSDEKERAEHTMLVDLARNDLGRVCRFGSVQVEEFMGIEKFSHVQHIVSTVHGTLRDNLDAIDALKSCFPAGTVSGAPKVRAMQIIDEVEPGRRGLYAGAVGYMGFDRNLEFAIAIRTILACQGRARIQVGAGIVADSVPENEWRETENKAQGMLDAIQMAGGSA
ncbi:MAG: anthranilate synthase component I [Methanomicrobiales archaeon]|nr:anthranilate synthase component I [Methanomicrobiales archaeon]MDI6875668.1 anthranilate synthase component I [Methanomicrobiales archaeon]